MLTVMFHFFVDSVTGNPSFSASDAPEGNPFGYRPLLLLGVGS